MEIRLADEERPQFSNWKDPKGREWMFAMQVLWNKENDCYLVFTDYGEVYTITHVGDTFILENQSMQGPRLANTCLRLSDAFSAIVQ